MVSDFSIIGMFGSLNQGTYAKQRHNYENSHKNIRMGNVKGDYHRNQSPVNLILLNVEAPVFPFSSDTHFNIFAKVFVLQTDIRCHDDHYYVDNAGKLHKYFSEFQFVKMSFSGLGNEGQNIISVNDDPYGYSQYALGEEVNNLDSGLVSTVGPGGLTFGPQSSVLLDKHILISGLDGELFSEEGTYNTCGWEQFEYQADCHQMSPSTNISENLVSMARTLGLTDSGSTLGHSNLPWVQDVEGNSVWCDSVNYVCRVSGCEGNNSVITSHSSPLCLNRLPMVTVKDGLSKNVIPTMKYLEGESDLVAVGVMHGMSGCVHPSPDQNTFSCTYSDNSV